jgi:hypothetical protein
MKYIKRGDQIKSRIKGGTDPYQNWVSFGYRLQSSLFRALQFFFKKIRENI